MKLLQSHYDNCKFSRNCLRMGFETDFKKLISEALSSGRFKNLTELAEASGLNQSSLSMYVSGTRQSLKLESVAKVIDTLGSKLSGLSAPSTDTTREICFVDAKVVKSGEGLPPPVPEHYAAVPLVGEVGAGPGMVPEDKLEGWVLVMRDQQAIRARSNLLAVEVGKNQTSMTPTLHPGDIVLVDRDDWGQYGTYKAPGNIFLVREPGQEGGAKVKRVDLSGKGNATILTFYSDNSEEYGPEPHIMTQDYTNGLREAIVGRVVWAWSDVSRK